MVYKNINKVEELKENIDWYNALLDIKDLAGYDGDLKLIEDECYGLYQFDFEDGSYITVDLCHGSTNYFDDCVWHSADDSRDVAFDCNYSIEETMEFEAEGNTYICSLEVVKNMNDVKYWSNCCGELHYHGKYDISEEELPAELQTAYNTLWTDGYGCRCYLAEYNGKYGVLLEADYSTEYASDINRTYEEVLKVAGEKARKYQEEYPQYDVLFEKDSIVFNDGSSESQLCIFLPWDTDKETFDKIAKHFESTCYVMPKKKPAKVLTLPPEDAVQAMKKYHRLEKLIKQDTAIDPKQMPGIKFLACPVCGLIFVNDKPNFCPECGQRISWNDK